VGALVLIALLLAACVPDPADGDDPTVRIAFFDDLSVPESLDLVSPSFLAFDTVVHRELASTAIEVELVEFDTDGDSEAAVEMADTVAADASFVLAVIAPFWREPPEVAQTLAEAGVPTLSLSPESGSPWASASSPAGDPAELWRRFVPDRMAEAELLAEAAAVSSSDSTQPVCLVSDESDHASVVAEAVDTALSRLTLVVDGSDPLEAAATVGSTGCAVVVWTGFPPAAAELDAAMRKSAPWADATIDLAGAALKTVMPVLSVDGERSVVRTVACACADVSIDTDLVSRTFVNAYQSKHGLAPGIYAVEAWDAGTVVAGAVITGVETRADMREAFRSITTVEGIVGTYTFDLDGEPTGIGSALYTAAGTRWLPGPG
jgi:branched-chain amino acid transport system substrate-binding protein